MVYGEKKELGCLVSSFRYFLMLVNLLFILGSIAGIVVSALLLSNEEGNILKFCKACHNFGLFSIIVFGALFVFSFLGFCALWKRNTCLLMIYAFVEIIFFLAALCILIIIIMIHEGKFDKSLNTAWDDEVSANPSDICEFSVKLNCSGWDAVCPMPMGLPGSYSYADNVTAARCAICTQEQYTSLMYTNQTCHNTVYSDLNKYFWALVGAASGLCALTLISVVISCKVRSEYEEYQELEERF